MRNTVLIAVLCLVALLAFRLGAAGSADNSGHAASSGSNKQSQAAQAAQPSTTQQETKETDDGLPQCDSESAKDSIKKTIENGAYSSTVKLQLVDMDGLAEILYDEEAQVRACIGKVVLNTGEGSIGYKFSRAKSDPSRVIITVQPIDFKLPEVSSDKDMDAGVKGAFQGTWNAESNNSVITFTGNYMVMHLTLNAGTVVTECRALKYERDNTSSSKGLATFSFCRPINQDAVDFDCKSSDCPAIDIANASLLEDGRIQISTGMYSFTLHKEGMNSSTVSTQQGSYGGNSTNAAQDCDEYTHGNGTAGFVCKENGIPNTNCKQYTSKDGKTKGIACEEADGTLKIMR